MTLVYKDKLLYFDIRFMVASGKFHNAQLKKLGKANFLLGYVYKCNLEVL